MGDTELQKLGFAWEVEDGASVPLGKIEKSYLSMMKGMEEFHRHIAKAMQSQNDHMEDAEQAAKDTQKSYKGMTGKVKEATSAFKENFLSLKDLGISWNSFIKGLAAISVGAAFVGVIAFLKRALEESVKFQKELARLNEVYSMNAKSAKQVSGALLGLELRAGYTREEVGELIRTMLDIGLTPKRAKKLGVTFQDLAKDILDIAGATGSSMEASAEFAEQLILINRIPAQGIRNTATALKYVADNTKITANELMNLNKSMEPIFASMGDMSAEARQKFTVNMLGVAGALSDAGVDASKSTEQMALMLKKNSKEGAEALAKLATFTGKAPEDLREMIKQNPAKVWDALAKAAAKMPLDELQLLGDSLQPLDLKFVDLAKLRKVGLEMEKGGKSFEKRAKLSAKAAADENKLAKDAAKRQAAIEAQMQRISKIWRDMLIRIGNKLSKKVVPLLEKKVVPLLEETVDLIERINWDDSFKEGSSWAGRLVDTVKFLVKYVVGPLMEAFSGVGTAIASVMKLGYSLFRALNSLITGDFQETGDWLKRYWSELWDGLYAAITYIPQLLGEIFGVDARSILNQFFDWWWSIFAGFWTKVGSFFKGVGKFLLNFHTKIIDTIVSVATKVAAVVKGLFTRAFDSIMGVIDKIIVYIAQDLIPKMLTFIPDKLLPKGFKRGLTNLGEDAEDRIAAREKARVSDAISRNPATPNVNVTTGGSSLSVPSKLTTSSPVQEQLASEQLAVAKQTRDILSKINIGQPSAKKLAVQQASGII